MASILQKEVKRKISLKNQTKRMNAYTASVIYHHLTIVPNTSLQLAKPEQFLFSLPMAGTQFSGHTDHFFSISTELMMQKYMLRMSSNSLMVNICGYSFSKRQAVQK